MRSIRRLLLVAIISAAATWRLATLAAEPPIGQPTTSPPPAKSPAAAGPKAMAPSPPGPPSPTDRGKIVLMEPPEKGFFSKLLDYDGIPIKAHKDVADEALFEAKNRLWTMLHRIPTVHANLKTAGAELHIIGRNQVTSDLPEHQHLKGKPFDGQLTVDERTRGLGGLLTSCGEENLLRLPRDRYRGRDICTHEFAHSVFQYGVPESVRLPFRQQRERSLAKGLWQGAYAGTNDHEYFAELAMWYFGTHGDLGMKGTKPAPGREGLKAYDREAFELLDRFYSGKIEVPKMGPQKRRAG